MFLLKENLTMNLNIMPKLYITKKIIYLNKRLDKITHNNQILSFKILCFINECFILIFVEMEVEPCNFFNAPYLLVH
jgi:hypothetical protein